jgi:alpha-amylase
MKSIFTVISLVVICLNVRLFCPAEAFGSDLPVAIFHAFDMKYDDLSDEKIARVKELGFTHIQTSPTQKSLEYGAWHDKYQPIAYEVGNRYGDSDRLKAMTERAHGQGLKVIADVVFNHLASVQGAEGGEWESALGSHDEGRINDLKHKLFEAYKNVFPDFKEEQLFDIFQGWNQSGWMGGNLPQLNTKNPIVRAVQIKYLETLLGLGIDGFRFDAAGSLFPESLEAYKNGVKSDWSYGEVISFQPETNETYSKILPLTDYVFTNELIKCFSIDGSLSSLKIPHSNGNPDSVTFAVTHDTWAASVSGGQSGVNITFPNEEDGDLAALFVLARHDGAPLILAQDIEKPSIRAGLLFRSEMMKVNAKMEFIIDANELHPDLNTQTLMIMERGNSGLVVLNKAAESLSLSDLDLTAYPEILGCYKQINSDNRIWIAMENDKKVLKALQGELKIEKRDGSFFVKVPNDECNKV